MVIRQGDVWWADLGTPDGSEAGYRRPVIVVQSDSLNGSRIATVLCVPLTGSLKWADAPGAVLLPSSATGLPRDSVANALLTFAVNKSEFLEHVGQVEQRLLDRVMARIDVVLGR